MITTDIIFLIIIAVYCLFGMHKGCIKSIGGLIGMVASWILSRTLAVPITNTLMNNTNIGTELSNLLQPMSEMLNATGDAVSGTMNGLIKIDGFGINQQAVNLGQTVVGILNSSGLNLFSTLTMVILFSLFMFIFGIIINMANKAFELVPMGKTLNALLGGVAGIVKGLIVSVIVYYIIICINLIFKASIPVEDSFITQVMQFIQNLKF